MNFREAEQIMHDYAGAVGREFDEDKTARYESWLPCSKAKIVIAFKIVLAHINKYKYRTKEEFNRYFVILNLIDSFLPDYEAEAIDLLNVEFSNNSNIVNGNEERFKPLFDYLCGNFLASRKIHDEVVDFFNEVKELDCNDDLYCQRVYTLAGLEFKPEYKLYFDNPNADAIIESDKSQKTRKSSPNFRIIVHILSTITGILFSIIDLFSRRSMNLIIIIISLIIGTYIQITANESYGEAKLKPSGLLTYIIIGLIGGVIFKPFFHGFFIINNLFDGIMLFIGIPKVFKNIGAKSLNRE